jgi:hypothetical protein
MLEGKKPLAFFRDEIGFLPREEIIPEERFRPYVECRLSGRLVIGRADGPSITQLAVGCGAILPFRRHRPLREAVAVTTLAGGPEIQCQIHYHGTRMHRSAQRHGLRLNPCPSQLPSPMRPVP